MNFFDNYKKMQYIYKHSLLVQDCPDSQVVGVFYFNYKNN
jgi:hypothetical protein